MRGLERQIGKLLRKVATEADTDRRSMPTTIGVDDVRKYLGRPRFQSEVAERTDTPGIATGLAVTGIGGDVLFIEAAHMTGDHGLTLTGQLGDVMKESVQIALSYVRSHADDLGIDGMAFKHRHFLSAFDRSDFLHHLRGIDDLRLRKGVLNRFHRRVRNDSFRRAK